ncbi:MAG: Nif3-like dinuclear metal center hexameric protein [Tissierellia bacterium]|nr:Nif3-like dinuclear metal center hexameric protein [Tissierellia bacterium]
MMRVEDIVEKMRVWAPEDRQEDWDNSGLQLYFPDGPVETVVVAMDVTPKVVYEAAQARHAMIVTHHPLFFGSLKSLDMSTIKGSMIGDLIRREVSVYSAHTSLDKAKGGVNDQWIHPLGLKKVRPLSAEEEMGIVGETSLSREELKAAVASMGVKDWRAYGSRAQEVKTVAFMGGSGADYISLAAAQGADLYITGDVKHHDAQGALEADIELWDIGHYGSEAPVLDAIARELRPLDPCMEVRVVGENEFSLEV